MSWQIQICESHANLITNRDRNQLVEKEKEILFPFLRGNLFSPIKLRHFVHLSEDKRIMETFPLLHPRNRQKPSTWDNKS